MDHARMLNFDNESAPRSTKSCESSLLSAVSTERNASALDCLEPSGLFSDGLKIADEEIVIASPLMKELYRLIDRVAMANFPVLISGETGSGKELAARAVHQSGPFSHGLLNAVNCGAIPTTLIESVLFGHERGAFTGAHKKSMGIFEQADGGTVFLDEVGELSDDAQAALLRVIETKRITRLGSNKEIEVDVRVVAATNSDLETMVDNGGFRKDLFYRLNAITLNVPPLRERTEEIGALASLFVRKACVNWNAKLLPISTEALELMREYNWPGNVRELRNVIERALIFCTSDRIRYIDLPENIRDASTKPDLVDSLVGNVQTLPPANDRSLIELVREYEHGLIKDALKRTGGNQSKAAQRLGIARCTLAKKIRGYGLLDKYR